MWMIAIKEHGYNGRRYAPGQKYQVLSPKDAIVLRVAGLAREAKKSEVAGLMKDVKKPEITGLTADAKKTIGHINDIPIKVVVEPTPPVYEQTLRGTIVTREELPEESDEPIVYEGATSPPEDEAKPKKRRRYRRKDMVPEE